MSTISGWYYLHTNNQLIYKRDSPGQDADIRDSDFCAALWAWTGDKANAYRMLIEALSLGAELTRVKQLEDLWFKKTDIQGYATSINVVLGEDGNMKTAYHKSFSDLHLDDCGFGETYIEAMADLCKQVGFKASKMWGKTFIDCLNEKNAVKS